MLHPFAAASLIAALSITATPARAQGVSGADVTLLDGGAHAHRQHLAGLEIDLEEGWKTYWRMPGEGGLSPNFDWSASTNIASVDIRWPRPSRLSDAYGDAIGYDRRVVLPLIVSLEEADAPTTLRATGLIGVCEKVCVPLDVSLSLALDPEARPGRIARALEAVPERAGPEERDAISITASDGALLVIAPAGTGDVFAAGPGIANGLSYAETEMETGEGLTAFEVPLRGSLGPGAELTVLAGETAFTVPVDVP